MIDNILNFNGTLETRAFLRVPFNINLSALQFDHPALYLIYFNTYDFYVGCTKIIKSRINQHRGYLRSGTHVNKVLQEKYNTLGEDNIDFYILTCKSREEARDIERAFLKENYNDDRYLNITSTSRGLTYGGRIDKLRKFARSTTQRIKVGKASRKNWKDPVYREKVLSKTSEGITVDNVYYYSVREASRKTGFSIQDLRRNLKNGIVDSKDIQLRTKTKSVMAEGMRYEKVGDAAKAYGVKDNTMTWRLKSTATKWKDFYYL